MSGLRVSRPDDLRARIETVRAQFAASGTTIKDWSESRGFNPDLVAGVLSGNRRCVRGESHRIAVALGIKDQVAPPGAQTSRPADRLGGIRS